MTTRYDSWADVLDYCRRSANPVGRLVLRIAGYRDARARSIVGRAVHGAAARRTSGRTSAATGAPAGCTCRARCCARLRRQRSAICDGRPAAPPAWAAALARCVAVTRGAVRRRTRGLRRRARPAALRAAPHLARRPRGSSSASSATRRELLHRAADARRARDVPALLWQRGALAAGCGLMARKTSFYYSFLVLPAEQRRAIIAVWDFCRAVDDAVDEDGPSGPRLPTARDAVAFWREELARCFDGGAPRDAAGAPAAAVHRAVRSAAPGVRGRDRRRRDGSRHDPVPDVRRSAASTAVASRRRSA